MGKVESNQSPAENVLVEVREEACLTLEDLLSPLEFLGNKTYASRGKAAGTRVNAVFMAHVVAGDETLRYMQQVRDDRHDACNFFGVHDWVSGLPGINTVEWKKCKAERETCGQQFLPMETAMSMISRKSKEVLEFMTTHIPQTGPVETKQTLQSKMIVDSTACATSCIILDEKEQVLVLTNDGHTAPEAWKSLFVNNKAPHSLYFFPRDGQRLRIPGDCFYDGQDRQLSVQESFSYMLIHMVTKHWYLLSIFGIEESETISAQLGVLSTKEEKRAFATEVVRHKIQAMSS